MGGFDGKTAVVTGGTRGIGAAIARTLAAAGARVVVTARSAEKADAFARTLPGQATGIALDVTGDPAAALTGLGPVDILVNNAGQAESAPFAKTDRALFQRMLDVNLLGVVACTQAVLPGMVERGFGRIVTVASTAGLVGYGYVSAYVAAKHAVIGLTKSVALETAKTGVTVNAVCPGYTDTDLVAEAVEKIVAKTGRTAEEARAGLAQGNPQGRLVRPEEVADCVLWLAGAGAGAVTGQAIAVAGGEVMR